MKNKHDLKGKPQISVFIVILELKIKSEEKISELWNRGINAVDFLYATNVGVLKFDSGSFKRILLDVSF